MSTASVLEQDGLMTVGDAAALMACSANFVRKLFDKGALPGTLINGSERRILRAFVAAWFAEVRFGTEVVVLEEFAGRWRAKQAERGAA